MDGSGPGPAGIHIIADLFECRLEGLGTVPEVSAVMEAAVAAAGLTCLGKSFHPFPGQGVTGILLLSQSHLALHTWPEEGYVSFDLFSCGCEADALRAYEVIRDAFAPGRVATVLLERGVGLPAGTVWLRSGSRHRMLGHEEGSPAAARRIDNRPADE